MIAGSIMESSPKFSSWLEQQYVQWQQQHGKRTKLIQFAKHLGISAPLLSHYMKGIRKPAGSTVHKLAQRLGPEIYDVLGLQRPDAQLVFISRNWSMLTEEQKREIVDKVKKNTKIK
jgi:hypothetical protein